MPLYLSLALVSTMNTMRWLYLFLRIYRFMLPIYSVFGIGDVPQECLPGSFGPGCMNFCGMCKDKSCDRETGICPTGCQSGYIGDTCNVTCAEYRHGPGCSDTCGRCYGDEPCYHEDGHCPRWCEAGYFGQDCKTPCPPTHYGFDCEVECGSCASGGCHPITGGCSLSGCAGNFTGIRCDVCRQGYHGAFCEKGCGQCFEGTICNPVDGTCALGCQPGWAPPLCDKEVDHRGTIIIVSSLGATIGLVVIMLVLLMIRLQRVADEKEEDKVETEKDELSENGGDGVFVETKQEEQAEKVDVIFTTQNLF